MTVTVGVTGNTLSINTCENATDWTGESPVDTTDFYKEGTQCVGFTVKGAGANDVTISGSWNLSGKHLRLWFMTVTIKELNDESANGLQIILGDASNTAYYTVGGGDTYPGGWWNIVLDCDRTPTSGTAPTLTAVTKIGVRMNHTGTAKNAENTWIDMIHCCDGLYAYGDDSGGSFDFDDILSADENTSNGWGVIRKIGGVYYLTGKLVFGDSASTNSCDFKDTSKVVIFEDRPVDSALYEIELVDNGTGTTEFQLGDSSGGRGISGCYIGVENTTQTPKWSFDAKTDTDVDNCKLYGCIFSEASTMGFPLTTTNVETISCNFEGCGVVTPQTSKMQYCNFIATDTDAITISSTTLNVTDSTFINPGDHGIEITSTGTYAFNNLKFSGTDGVSNYDIENTTAGSVTINCTNGSDPGYYENTGGGSTTINNSVYLTVYVKDKDNNDIQGASVAIYKSSDDSELMNETTDVDGMAQETYNYTADTDVYIRIRKSSTGSTRYIPIITTGTIESGGYTLTAVLSVDGVI